jgi:predicted nucleic acid-binding protein
VSAGGGVLVDTSAWIETLRPEGDEGVRAAVQAATEEGRTVLCDMVLLELWNGARGDAEKRFLRDLEGLLRRVPTTDAVWETARDLARQCRTAGLTLPGADLLVAACAEHHRLELLHHDRHFDQLPQRSGRPR